MAKAIHGVNWGAIAIAYASGETADSLGKKYGIRGNTILEKARKQGWNRKAIRKKLEKDGVKPPPTEAEENRALCESVMASRKNLFLEKAADVVTIGSSKLAKKIENTQDLKTINRIGEAQERFTRSAKTVFGLGDGDSIKVGIQMNILSQLPEQQAFTIPAIVRSE